MLTALRKLDSARRNSKIGIVFVVAGIIGAVIVCALPKDPEVTFTNIVYLTPGMSDVDVSNLLGPPSADVSARPPTGLLPPMPGGKLLQYAGERATVTVEFDASGRVVRSLPEIHMITAVERVRLRLDWW